MHEERLLKDEAEEDPAEEDAAGDHMMSDSAADLNADHAETTAARS